MVRVAGGTRTLLEDGLSRTAQLRREILELRQAIPHWEYGLGVVHVYPGYEVERRDGGCIDVYKAERRMIGHQVTAAAGAILAATELRLLIGGDEFRTFGDTHRIRLPQGKCVYGCGRPRAARTAVAVAHCFRGAGDLNDNRAAKASTNMGHPNLL